MMKPPPPQPKKKKFGRHQAEPNLFDTTKPKSNSTLAARFLGTDNPRQLRIIGALMHGPVMREEIDRAAGASNGPAVIAALRRRGLAIPCAIVQRVDRDGGICRPGIYTLTATDKRLIQKWLDGLRG